MSSKPTDSSIKHSRAAVAIADDQLNQIAGGSQAIEQALNTALSTKGDTIDLPTSPVSGAGFAGISGFAGGGRKPR